MSDKAFFVGHHAALDFLNTIAAPREETIEFIADGNAYVTWLTDVGLLAPTEAQGLLDKFGKPALDRVASEARELREWFRRLIAKPARRRTADDVATLNQILAIDCSRRQLEESDKRLVLREKREFVRVRQLLVPVAEAIGELLANGDSSLIKRCANPSCTLWFYDRTKAGLRRFCSAAVCGNRAKVAAFRERQRRSK
ncbi:MAG: ABATE domain-containing protein [Nitrosomonadales bacterium]|nr:ABATE domain-containing protein [Nitrosomonadales bacterium]